jgi:stringent starvation protein B
MTMISSRPYLIRALYEWIVDNGLTPYISVNANIPQVVVPDKYVKNGKIVLNISHQAVQALRVGNDGIECKARFGGRIAHLYIPILAVTAIFAHETGRGMVFAPEEAEKYIEEKPEKPPIPLTPPKPKKTKKPHLTLVKSEK